MKAALMKAMSNLRGQAKKLEADDLRGRFAPKKPADETGDKPELEASQEDATEPKEPEPGEGTEVVVQGDVDKIDPEALAEVLKALMRKKED